MTRVPVITFVQRHYQDVHWFDTLAEADAWAHGARHGFTLAGGGSIYVAVLPRDEQEMHSLIPPDALQYALAQVQS